MAWKDVVKLLSNKAETTIKNTKGFENKHLISPADAFRSSLRFTSGSEFDKSATGILYQTVGFRGVCDGYGTSLLVANTAIALASKGLKVCVVDTSILRPVQDLYLNTGVRLKNPAEVLDWFDLPFTNKNVLGVSSINNNINVLCFSNRTIVDALSTSDSEDLVITALRQLESRYDVILIDICNEPTAVAMASMMKSHTVFQVWSNDMQVLNTIPSFITNVTTLACTVDKLKYVITSSVIENVPTNWETVLNNYGFKLLTSVPFSHDIARITSTGKPLWGYPSNADGVLAFNNAIADICNKILGADTSKVNAETLSIEEIENGEVEGTTTYKLAYPPQEAVDFRNTVKNDTQKALHEMQYIAGKVETEDNFDLFSEETLSKNTNKKEGFISKVFDLLK